MSGEEEEGWGVDVGGCSLQKSRGGSEFQTTDLWNKDVADALFNMLS
jgi:hypothetical protein